MRIDLYIHDVETDSRLDQILDLLRGDQKLMSALDDSITSLTAAVQADTTAEQSAITLINGIPGLIATAVSQALAAGATPAELASLTALQTTLTTNAANLAAAVVAGTPAAPSAPVSPTPTSGS